MASAVGFIGGAVPNYILNRRWAWRDRRGRDRRTEVLLYMVVASATFVVSAVVTHLAEEGACHLTVIPAGRLRLRQAPTWSYLVSSSCSSSSSTKRSCSQRRPRLRRSRVLASLPSFRFAKPSRTELASHKGTVFKSTVPVTLSHLPRRWDSDPRRNRPSRQSVPWLAAPSLARAVSEPRDGPAVL